MSTSDPRHYDVVFADHHRKATNASERNQSCSRSRVRTKPQIKEAVEKLFDVKVKSVNTLVRKGKHKPSAAARRAIDVKKAIVTLEEATASTDDGL